METLNWNALRDLQYPEIILGIREFESRTISSYLLAHQFLSMVFWKMVSFLFECVWEGEKDRIKIVSVKILRWTNHDTNAQTREQLTYSQQREMYLDSHFGQSEEMREEIVCDNESEI